MDLFRLDWNNFINSSASTGGERTSNEVDKTTKIAINLRPID